jgi:hypothetical protein
MLATQLLLVKRETPPKRGFLERMTRFELATSTWQR